MTVAAYPYRARAWRGEALVAESDSCLCVERDGAPSVLYFPQADIDLSRFHDAGGAPAEGVSEVGGVRRLGLDAPAGGPPAARDAEQWSTPAGSTAGADEVLTLVTAPAAGFGALGNHGAFDQDRVRVEVVDSAPGDDPRDVTVKRFPTWGDATHLIDLLDVRRDGDLGFVSVARTDGRRPVVEGSQMLGQAIVAAGRHLPGRRVVSAAMLFLRAADAHHPLRVELGELSAGRTFAGLTAQVLQDGRCCAGGTLLLDATGQEVVRHAVDPPAVPGPYDCPPYDMGVTGRDLRVVDGAYTNDPDAPAGPPTIDAWVRFRHVPDDQALHAGLLAQFTGHMSIAAALRPHPGVDQMQAHRTLSMGINAITLSLHRPVRADRWMLYHHESTFAGDGMTHAACRVHQEDGALVASFAVDAMVRPFPSGAAADERTAL